MCVFFIFMTFFFLIPIAVYLLTGIKQLRYTWKKNALYWREDAFEYFAEITKLKYTLNPKSDENKIQGNYKGFQISIAEVFFNKKANICVTIKCNLLVKIDISKKTIKRRMDNLLSQKNELLIGDNFFDEILLSEGIKEDVLLFFNSKMRELIKILNNSIEDFRIDSKEIQMLFTSEREETEHYVIQYLDDMIQLINGFQQKITAEEKLLYNISIEKKSEVKIKILDAVLDGVFSDKVNKESIVTALLNDTEWRVRINTAMRLGMKGTNLLISFFRKIEVYDDRVLIIKLLGKSTEKKALDFIVSCISSNDTQITKAACLYAMHPDKKIMIAINELAEDNTIAISLRDEAKAALARLRKNLPDNEGGWLSVSDKDESGALSLGKNDFEEGNPHLE